MDRGAWRAIVPGVVKSRTRLKQLGTDACAKGWALCPWEVAATITLKEAEK